MPSGYEPSQWAHCGEIGRAITEDEEAALWAQNDQPQEREHEQV